MRIFLLLCLTCLTSLLQAQYITNVSVKQRPNEVGKMVMYIHYDLTAKANNIPFRVSASFKSKEGEIRLKKLIGSHGDLIYPGLSKEIIWDYQEELVHFSGDGDIKVDAVPNINAISKVKRGKELALKLDPVLEKSKQYTAELYRNGQTIAILGGFSGEKDHLEFKVPRKIKTKKDYQVKIVGGEKELFSGTFAIKPKVPLLVKMLPIAGTMVFIIIKITAPEPESSLPGAPIVN